MQDGDIFSLVVVLMAIGLISVVAWAVPVRLWVLGSRVLDDLLDLARTHAQHAVAHVTDGCVVRDQEHGRTQLVVDLLQDGKDQDARLRVERAGRLVAQKNSRSFGHRARDGDALLLAAGELGGEVVGAAAQADEVDHGPGFARVGRNLRVHGDILERRQARDEATASPSASRTASGWRSRAL